MSGFAQERARWIAALEQGAEAWNLWRLAHPGVESAFFSDDLRGRDLSHYNLQGLNLSGLDSSGCATTRAPDRPPPRPRLRA